MHAGRAMARHGAVKRVPAWLQLECQRPGSPFKRRRGTKDSPVVRRDCQVVQQHRLIREVDRYRARFRPEDVRDEGEPLAGIRGELERRVARCECR
jgi:hypothetical protein